MKITDVLMECQNPKCRLVCKVIDCEPDIDGDGGLGCPRCWLVLRKKTVMKEYLTEH